MEALSEMEALSDLNHRIREEELFMVVNRTNPRDWYIKLGLPTGQITKGQEGWGVVELDMKTYTHTNARGILTLEGGLMYFSLKGLTQPLTTGNSFPPSGESEYATEIVSGNKEVFSWFVKRGIWGLALFHKLATRIGWLPEEGQILQLAAELDRQTNDTISVLAARLAELERLLSERKSFLAKLQLVCNKELDHPTKKGDSAAVCWRLLDEELKAIKIKIQATFQQLEVIRQTWQ